VFFVFGTLGGGNGEGKREGSCRTPKTRQYGCAMAVRHDVGRRGRRVRGRFGKVGGTGGGET